MTLKEITGANIKKYRNKIGLSQLKLAELTGIGRSSLAQYESAFALPPLDNALTIAKTLQTTVDRIIGEPNIIESDKIVNIPFYKDTYASAGGGSINYELMPPASLSFNKEFLENVLSTKQFKNIHAIRCIGNSMEPTLKNGEMLFVNPVENEGGTTQNGAIYVVNYYGEVYVKRVTKDPKTKALMLHSDNKEEHPPMEIKDEDLNECQIVGRVVGHLEWV